MMITQAARRFASACWSGGVENARNKEEPFMTVTEKVAYLKGLAQGLGMDADNKQDKLIAAIIDVLDDVALSLAD